jgi:hypothetical protein
MRKRVVGPVIAAGALGLAAGDAEAQASRFRPLPGQDAAGKVPRAGLPYARGRSFATLDAYLAFRREQGAIDLPWYKEVAPDVFELQTRMRPQPEPRRFTRAELARKYGFPTPR